MLGLYPRRMCVILRKNLQPHLPASAEKGQLPGIWNLLALSCMGVGERLRGNQCRREVVPH